jgi:hypothetical protein
MRQAIFDYIYSLGLGGYTLSDSLPWEDNGVPLYHHNKKYIYVDSPNTTQVPQLDTFSNTGTVEEEITVSVFFVNDAKMLPPDYDTTVELIKGARTATGTEGYIQKLVQVKTSYMSDSLVTSFEFSFRRLLTN